jgi:hypothetical protein
MKQKLNLTVNDIKIANEMAVDLPNIQENKVTNYVYQVDDEDYKELG